ncbi:MAG: hypothetical protein ACYDCL_02075 [Myxococcales bacterium]
MALFFEKGHLAVDLWAIIGVVGQLRWLTRVLLAIDGQLFVEARASGNVDGRSSRDGCATAGEDGHNDRFWLAMSFDISRHPALMLANATQGGQPLDEWVAILGESRRLQRESSAILVEELSSLDEIVAILGHDPPLGFERWAIRLSVLAS